MWRDMEDMEDMKDMEDMEELEDMEDMSDTDTVQIQYRSSTDPVQIYPVQI